MRFYYAFFVAFLIMATCSYAYAHGGGLDKNGCHHDNSNGSYHCH